MNTKYPIEVFMDALHKRKHLTVMRVIEVLRGRGIEGAVLEITPKRVLVALSQPYLVTTEPVGKLHLYAALIRPELFEFIVQKTTELGVASITPLITERTVRIGFKRPRLELIAQEAAELSGRGIVPTLYEPLVLSNVFSSVTAARVWCIADQGGEPVSQVITSSTPEAALLIGPEGGWTDRERAHAEEAGMRRVTLGTTMLRAETAAVVGCFAFLQK
jgi:16S rRNA (uracil1498-N3)-methyltransferase